MRCQGRGALGIRRTIDEDQPGPAIQMLFEGSKKLAQEPLPHDIAVMGHDQRLEPQGQGREK